MSSWRDALGALAAETEPWLAEWMDALDAPPALVEAMRYSLCAGGKRLRPALALAAAEAAGATGAAGRPPALIDLCCALEAVHTYSLIHDDLPAMDDDALRRGRPTNHVVYGEALAILAGDALLTEAFARLASGPPDEAPRRLRLVALLAREAGAWGMVGGQTLDIAREASGAGAAALEEVHAKKTGALITAACVGGGLAAGAPEATLSALETYGRAVGLAFQLADDLLDATGDPAKLGKGAQKDQARGTATGLSELGLEGSRARAEALIRAATEALAPLGPGAAPLAALARGVLERDR